MVEKPKELTMKISRDVKNELDKLKPFPRVSYDTVLRTLLEKDVVDGQPVDADWKTRKERVHFMKCPKCGGLTYLVLFTSLLEHIEEYLIYGSVIHPKAMKTVMVNSSKFRFKSLAEVEKFLVELKDKNPETKKIGAFLREGFKIDFDGLEDIEYSPCYKCGEGIAIDDWEEGSKLLTCYTCPKCGTGVFDDSHHRNSRGVIMCPRLHYHFDWNWEIFNHIDEESPTIDHVRYDKRKKIIMIHPYECNPRYLARFIRLADKLGYIVRIIGASKYHEATLSIYLRRDKRRISVNLPESKTC